VVAAMLVGTLYRDGDLIRQLWSMCTRRQKARSPEPFSHLCTLCIMLLVSHITHIQYSYTYSIHTHTVSTHIQYSYTYSIHTHTASTHIQYSHTQYSHTYQYVAFQVFNVSFHTCHI
jgi:hypothetical protein